MLRRLAEWLVYSQLWIAIGAAAQVWLAGAYFGFTASEITEHHLTYYAAAVFFGSVSFYAFHRLYTLWGFLPDFPTQRWKITYIYQRWLFGVVPLGGLLALIYMLLLPWPWTALAAVPALISSCYALPVISGRRVRDFGKLKLPWLVLGWVWICSAVPAIQGEGLFSWYVLERLLFILGFAIAFDHRDLQLDVASSVHTWAAKLGTSATAGVSFVSLGISLGLNLYLSNQADASSISSGVAFAQAITSFCAIPMVLLCYGERKPGHLYYGFGLDALLIAPLLIAYYYA